jgi:hypothetical protein
MATYFEVGLTSLKTRLVEFDLIVQEAQKHLTSNTPLHDALCRSAHILLIAHFEGYVKQIVKDCLDDVNSYSSFKQSKLHLKKKLCENFIPVLENNRSNHKKIFELIEILDPLETKFKKEYFLHADNKNPKATVLDRIVKNFGVENFFNKVKQSKLDQVFSNTLDENIKLCDKFGNLLNKWTVQYPYNIDFKFLEIDQSKKTNDNLWDTFLNNILQQRHNIAHGTLTENSLSCKELQENKIKVQILIYALSMFICDQCNPDSGIN